MSGSGGSPFETLPVPQGSPPPPGQETPPILSPVVTTSSGPEKITYVIGVCLMVAVALFLAVLACLLRRKYRRNQAAMAAEREARFAALREAAELEAVRLAELGLHPYKPPVVVVQPNGEAILAEQLASGSAACEGLAPPPPPYAQHLAAHSSSSAQQPALPPSPFMQPAGLPGHPQQQPQPHHPVFGVHTPMPSADMQAQLSQSQLLRLQLVQQQQALVEQAARSRSASGLSAAAASAATAAAPPDWHQAAPPPSHTTSHRSNQ